MTGAGAGIPQGRMRGIAAVVILILIIVVVLTDIFGRLFVDASFRVSDLMLGSLIGALLLLVGIDVSKRWPFGAPGRPEPAPDEPACPSCGGRVDDPVKGCRDRFHVEGKP